MLKIGDFSNLAHVTVKTLRHYDRLGLLKPVWVDRFTGYRYYSLEQLPRLNRILALKDLGFSLDQISQFLKQDLPAGQLRELMLEKQRDLQLRLQQEQRRLSSVAARLEQIEREGNWTEEVTLKSVKSLTVASVREMAPTAEQVSQWSQQVFTEIATWLQQQGIRPANSWLTLHNNPEYRERAVSFEVAAVLRKRFARKPTDFRGEPVCVYQLPAVPEMASTIVGRGTAGLFSAYAALYKWTESNGYQVVGPVREVYLREDGQAEAQIVEVQFPVESIRRPVPTYIQQKEKEYEMEPKFITLPARTYVGVRYQGKNPNNEIGQLWVEFNQRADEIQHFDPQAAYGLCRVLEGLPEGEFEYVAAFAVDKIEDVPQDMVVRELPEMKCAVFSHQGSLETLRDTYHEIYHNWLPQSGYEAVEPGLDMEMYNEEFKDFSENSVFYIYLPVK